jgi:hypothetical protein
MALILLYFQGRDNRWILKDGFHPGKARARRCSKGIAGRRGRDAEVAAVFSILDETFLEGKEC